MAAQASKAFEILKTIRRFPIFFLGVFVCGIGLTAFFVYICTKRVIEPQFISSNRNTTIEGLHAVCKRNGPKVLRLETEVRQQEREGSVFVESVQYCGNVHYIIDGTFEDFPVGVRKEKCTGKFHANVSIKDGARVIFDLRYNSSEGCPDNGTYSGMLLYKEVTILQSYIFKLKRAF